MVAYLLRATFTASLWLKLAMANLEEIIIVGKGLDYENIAIKVVCWTCWILRSSVMLMSILAFISCS